MTNFEFQLHLFREPKFPAEVPAMTPQEHKQFVQGLVNEEIFSSMHIHEADKKKGDLGRVFTVQGAGHFQIAKPEFIENIGVLWEFVKDKSDKTTKGSISGVEYPMFLTTRLCSRADWDLACDAVGALKARSNIVLAKS